MCHIWFTAVESIPGPGWADKGLVPEVMGRTTGIRTLLRTLQLEKSLNAPNNRNALEHLNMRPPPREMDPQIIQIPGLEPGASHPWKGC